MMKTMIVSSLTLVLGLAGGIYLTSSGQVPLLGPDPLMVDDGVGATDGEAQPLYWVAPMDPSYRRDKPGKSPMGMDLVPVYEESNSDDSPGLVSIDPEVENNLGVRTALVVSKPMNPDIRTVGYIGFNEDSLWQINSRVSGWIEKLHVKTVGESIRKGQPLLTLYSPELVKAQEELLNALRLGNKTLISSSRSRLQALGIGRGQVQSIEKQRQVRQNITLYARESGYLSRLNVRQGAYVSPATQVLEAGRLDNVWLQAELFESQAGLISVGDPALMSLDFFPGQEWVGTVDYIYPVLTEDTRTLQVRLRFDNPDEQLKPNMYARVRMQPESSKAVLQIPREAVIRSGQADRVVMARGEGKFQSVAVRTGRESQGMVQILEGLEDGDRIVTSAHFMLDSESSLTADLSRMGPPDRWVESTMVKGVVIQVKADALTISHEPVPDWNWPGMVMDFPLAESVSKDGLMPGRAIQFEIIKLDGNFPIQSIQLGEMTELPAVGEVDHSQMDHSQMDHSQMDHDQGTSDPDSRDMDDDGGQL